MAWFEELPTELLAKAERRSWFRREDALLVLDWIDARDRLLAEIEVAEKMSDGKWTLLLEPMLSLANEDWWKQLDAAGAKAKALEAGREFLSEHVNSELMFEPLW